MKKNDTRYLFRVATLICLAVQSGFGAMAIERAVHSFTADPVRPEFGVLAAGIAIFSGAMDTWMIARLARH